MAPKVLEAMKEGEKVLLARRLREIFTGQG